MKLISGINILSGKDVEKSISKKIVLANTSKRYDKEIAKKSYAVSNDPLYNNVYNYVNPDIRYRNYLNYSPLANIDYRNALFMFAENKEIKKAVGIMADEIVVIDSDNYKYPLYPELNLTMIDEDKQQVGQAIIDYLDGVFYPKLYQMLNFKKDGLMDMIKEFLITGKIAYEIVYDDLKNPKEIIAMQSIDPATLQKFKYGDFVYYLQKSPYGDKDRVLHENQVVLLEWNKYDFGYVSYIDGLRMSFNTMRAMQTSKVLWFATKSQVRMHIKLALGDVSREEAFQRLSEARNDYTNNYKFTDDGQVLFNNEPNNSGYREFFTAETNSGGHPDIEEVTGNGPDLSEVDSLTYWERLFWNDTGIPFDRIDPNASESWGFLDVEQLKKTEVIFAKQIEAIRTMLEPVVLKPIIIQLTIKEVEIGVDLSLLDSIKISWVTYNQYEKLADLEILNKKIELVSNIKDFGTLTNSIGNEINMFSVKWLARNYLGFTESELELIENERKREMDMLGYNPDGTSKIDENSEGSEHSDELSDEDDFYK